MLDLHPIAKWGQEVDRWIERAALGQLPPRQARLVDLALLLAAATVVGLGLLWPGVVGVGLLLILMMTCFFHGHRGAVAAGPLAAAFYLLRGSLVEVGWFLAACLMGTMFSVVTVRKFRISREQALRLVSALDQARCVQRCLEPERLVRSGPLQVATYINVCAELGGDLLTLRNVETERVGVLLADVMGKGVQAALAAAYIEGMYDELARSGCRPAHIVARINARLCQRFGGQELFATLVCLEAALTERQWCYTRAGHSPPLLCRRDGRFEGMDCPGLPAGIDEKVEYSECRIPMAPGDQLLLTSDGLLEFELEPPEVAWLVGRRARQDIDGALAGLVQDLRDHRRRRRAPDDETAALLRVDWPVCG